LSPAVSSSPLDVAHRPPRLASTTRTAAFSPATPGPEIWVGVALPVTVFALGTWEFTKRILIQRRCAVCGGTGLVSMGGGSAASPGRLVKCRACGGFFPWQSWQRFLSSEPGNGGPLQQPTLPRQAGVLYKVPSVEEARAAAQAAGVATATRVEGEGGSAAEGGGGRGGGSGESS
jgi:hypothetical protein